MKDGRKRVPWEAGICILCFQTSATSVKAKCQLRLARSGMPSRASLRRHWIFYRLKTRFYRLKTQYTYTCLPRDSFSEVWRERKKTDLRAGGLQGMLSVFKRSKCGFSLYEIQCLRRLMREGIPERISRS